MEKRSGEERTRRGARGEQRAGWAERGPEPGATLRRAGSPWAGGQRGWGPALPDEGPPESGAGPPGLGKGGSSVAGEGGQVNPILRGPPAKPCPGFRDRPPLLPTRRAKP